MVQFACVKDTSFLAIFAIRASINFARYLNWRAVIEAIPHFILAVYLAVTMTVRFIAKKVFTFIYNQYTGKTRTFLEKLTDRMIEWGLRPHQKHLIVNYLVWLSNQLTVFLCVLTMVIAGWFIGPSGYIPGGIYFWSADMERTALIVVAASFFFYYFRKVFFTRPQ